MIISELTLKYADISTMLIPRLREHVFHVTCQRNVPSILAAGEIRPNPDGALPSTFGSSTNGFFRLRGRVSVFDYRNVAEEDFDDALHKCSPYQAARRCDYELAIFFLAPEAHDRLEPWTLWHSAEAYSQMVVPYVEAGYPGPIPLAAISEVLYVKLHYTPSALELAIEASWKSRETRSRGGDKPDGWHSSEL